jgi:hypothetical protein
MRARLPDPPPVVSDDVRPVLIGTVLWLVGLAVSLVAGRGAWAATCAAGFALGLIGLVYVRRRAAAIARERAGQNGPDSAGT